MSSINKGVETEININDILRALLAKWWIIVITAVVAFGAILGYCSASYTPEYSSTSSIYILKQQSESTNQVNATDLAIATNIMEDCKYILTSREVLETVIANVGLECDYRQLRSKITVTHPEESRVLVISARADSPERAKAIADEIGKVCAVALVRIMSVDQVNIIDSGSFSEVPSNSRFPASKLIIAFVVIFAVCAVIIIVGLADTRIKTLEDIERTLGLTVLGDIPNTDATKKKKYGKKYKYGYKEKEQ